ncbi:MAG: FkbM family methyltransferase [Reyranella sp.]|uniref:FkbM family methyltransferase n=1 Tax=Reyranella sp. TaxID=1929291 RepID=UPI0012228B4B|nr:FkbM family methyltransferase [Reyranella sp.]TAJ41540.1 MAG: FkbM family methyltransferase [Reyranella sp.]
MTDRITTDIPGRKAIELVAFYESFRDYYPQCELQTKNWFVKNVQTDWSIFDIGANVGYYSILFAQLAFEGKVFAFEPTSTVSMLRKNIAHHRLENVEIHEVALGASTAVLKDRIFRIWGTEGDVQDYNFYRFDDFVFERHIDRIDCLKIDVDSFDFEVLRGAEQTLVEKNPYVVVELSHALSRRNQSAGEALAWLAKLGYRESLVLDHDNYVLHRAETSSLGVPNRVSINLLFPPPLKFEETLAEGRQIVDDLLGDTEFQNGAEFAPEGGHALALPTGQEGSELTTLRRQSLWTKWRLRRESKTLAVNPPSGPSPQRIEGGVNTLRGRVVETSPQAWSNSLTVHLPPRGVQAWPDDYLLEVELKVEVTKGQLGVVLTGLDLSKFSSIERVISAMPGPQSVVIAAKPSEKVSYLLFRNAAFEGTRTCFRLLDVRASSTKRLQDM